MQGHVFFHSLRMFFQEFSADADDDGSVDQAFSVCQNACAGPLGAQDIRTGNQRGVSFPGKQRVDGGRDTDRTKFHIF